MNKEKDESLLNVIDEATNRAHLLRLMSDMLDDAGSIELSSDATDGLCYLLLDTAELIKRVARAAKSA